MPSAVNGETAWMLVVNFWISPVIEIFFNHLATSITFLYSSLLQGVSLFYMIINWYLLSASDVWRKTRLPRKMTVITEIQNLISLEENQINAI